MKVGVRQIVPAGLLADRRFGREFRAAKATTEVGSCPTRRERLDRGCPAESSSVGEPGYGSEQPASVFVLGTEQH